MKKLLITFLVLLGLAAVCVVTCPDRQAHKDAIMPVLNYALNQQMGKLPDDGWGAIGASVGTKIIEMGLDNLLEVKNCFIFSIGQVQHEDGNETISIGILGHVFTMSKEDFSEAFDEYYNN